MDLDGLNQDHLRSHAYGGSAIASGASRLVQYYNSSVKPRLESIADPISDGIKAGIEGVVKECQSAAGYVERKHPYTYLMIKDYADSVRGIGRAVKKVVRNKKITAAAKIVYRDVYFTSFYGVITGAGGGIGNVLHGDGTMAQGIGQTFVNNFQPGLVINAVYPLVFHFAEHSKHFRPIANSLCLTVNAVFLYVHIHAGSPHPYLARVAPVMIGLMITNQLVSNIKERKESRRTKQVIEERQEELDRLAKELGDASELKSKLELFNLTLQYLREQIHQGNGHGVPQAIRDHISSLSPDN